VQRFPLSESVQREGLHAIWAVVYQQESILEWLGENNCELPLLVFINKQHYFEFILMLMLLVVQLFTS
jgi:hypothetical protein